MFDDFNQAPAFQFAERACFRDAHGVADLRLAVLVVSVEAFDLFDDLAKLRMRNTGRSFDDRRLLHLSRDDLADTLLAQSASRLGGGSGSFLAHDVLLCRRGGLCVLLGQHGLDTRDFAAENTKLAWFLKLAALLLQTEVKNLFLQFPLAGLQLFAAEVADFFGLHTRKYSLSRNPVAGNEFGPNRELIRGEAQ